MRQVHRVKRGPANPPLVLPKDNWKGCTFIEADGTICEVVYSGKHLPDVNLARRSQSSCQKVGHPVIGP